MIDFKYKDMFEQGSTPKLISIKSDDETINVNTSKIHYEQLELSHSLCSEEQLTFGCCEASCLKYRTTNNQVAGVGKWVKAELAISGKDDEKFNCGIFKIYSETPTDDKRYKDVVAYDKMYDIINTDVAGWYNNLEFPMTIKEFRDSFFEYLDIAQKTATLASDEVSLEKTIIPSTLSGRDVITSICEINGCFGHIAADGEFEYKFLQTDKENAYEIPVGNRKSLKFEDYEVQKIEAVQIRQEEDDIGAVYPPNATTGANAYITEDNFLVYGMSSAELATVAENLFNVVKDITYVPLEVSVKGNPCLELADMVKVNLKDGTELYSYVLTHDLNGLQQITGTITAQGNKYYDQNINGSNREFMQLRGKTNLLTRTVEETLSKITEITEDLGEVSSQIQQVAGKIITEITAGGEVQSRFSQELGKFMFEGQWFSIHTDNITIDDTTLQIDNGYIGGLRIGSEGLSSDDYTTLQIFKDGTGKFTNLYGNGQGYIDLTSHHPTDNEKDVESFFRTTDGFHADYDTENNISVGMYVNKDGNAILSRHTGKQKSRTETGSINLVLEKNKAKLTDKDGNLLPIEVSNIPKTSFSKIKLVNSTFDPSITSDKYFNRYIRDINHAYSFLDKIQNYAETQTYAGATGFPIIIASYESGSTVHFIAQQSKPIAAPYARFLFTHPIKFACMQSNTMATYYQQAYIDIAYDTTTGNITHQGYQKLFPGFDTRYESYTELPSDATNISIYFSSIIDMYVIELYATETDYNNYYYQSSDNMLRKNSITGTVIANVRQGQIEENTISAATTEDAFSIKAGENINIFATGGNNEITISAEVPSASESQSGTMSPADKVKLDEIQAGAEQNVQADWNVNDVNSDAYIKNKPASMPASDVYDWAKQPAKPTYTAEEVGADARGTGAIVYDQSKRYADKAVTDAFTKENVTNALGYTPYTQQEVDNKLSALETNIDWKESVATYADIAKTYPNPDDGWTVNVKDTDYTYRFNGTNWVAISANAIPLATEDTNGLLSAIDKKNYDKAYKYSQESHAPVDAEHNIINAIKRNGTELTVDNNRAVDIIVPTKTSELDNDSGFLKETDIKDLSNKLDKTGDASNTTVSFTQATARVNITTGEKLSALFGKIARWFSDLKAVAFSGSYNDLNDKPTSLPANGGNAATATKLATAKSINGASFDGTRDIQLPLYFSNRFGSTGNTIKYAIFCKMKKDNLYGEGETTMLLTAHGNFGGTIAGTYLVSISNRGGKVTMRIIALQQENSGQSTTEFGYYEDDDYFYCGVKRPSYSYSENITVFSRSSGFTVGIVLDTATEPTGWVKVETYKLAKTIDTVSKAYALDSSAGSTTQPVYFKDGKPVACGYSVNKSVPANAVFTDTWRGIQNNLASDSATDSLSAAQGKILNERIDIVWEKLQAIGGDHIFWENVGVASAKISNYTGIYVQHGEIVIYSCVFTGKGSAEGNVPIQIITGLPIPTIWTALSVIVNGTDVSQHEAYIDTDGSIYMKNVTNQQVFISGAYICSSAARSVSLNEI